MKISRLQDKMLNLALECVFHCGICKALAEMFEDCPTSQLLLLVELEICAESGLAEMYQENEAHGGE